jgi:hypothetical protein
VQNVHGSRVFEALASVVSGRVNSAALEARQAVRAALEAIFVLVVGRSHHLLFNRTASVFRNRVFSQNTDGNTGRRNILRKNAKAKERGVGYGGVLLHATGTINSVDKLWVEPAGTIKWNRRVGSAEPKSALHQGAHPSPTFRGQKNQELLAVLLSSAHQRLPG